MIVRAQGRTDRALTTERATMVAVATMERWRRAVRVMPPLVSSDLRVALLGLSAWYERLCVDPEYTMSGPQEGIDALHHATQLNSSQTGDESLMAWWAVRVAEEVVQCRRLLRSTDASECTDLENALSRLEVALQGGHDHLTRLRVSLDEITKPAPKALNRRSVSDEIVDSANHTSAFPDRRRPKVGGQRGWSHVAESVGTRRR